MQPCDARKSFTALSNVKFFNRVTWTHPLVSFRNIYIGGKSKMPAAEMEVYQLVYKLYNDSLAIPIQAYVFGNGQLNKAINK